MNLMIYLLGTLLVIVALAYGAHLLGINQTWIVIGADALLGLGIVTGVTSTRQKDPPET